MASIRTKAEKREQWLAEPPFPRRRAIPGAAREFPRPPHRPPDEVNRRRQWALKRQRNRAKNRIARRTRRAQRR